MSAAAAPPPPPPGRSHAMALNGYHGPPATANGAASAGNDRPCPHLNDIVASAEEKANDLKKISIAHLVDQGKRFYDQALFRADNRGAASAEFGLASAYWAYLVSYLIMSDKLRKHPDFYDRIDSSRGGLQRDYKQLKGNLDNEHERFLHIKRIIQNNNLRNNTQPGGHSTRPSSSSNTQYTPTPDMSQSSAPSMARRRDDELMLPEVPASQPDGQGFPADPSESPRRKPHVQPKPQNLHGRAIHQSTASNGSISADDLAERFARLRAGPAAPPIDTSAFTHGQPAQMPSPSDFAKPMGPRAMPPPPSFPPALPKLPLNTQLAASMPKEPSPTYSPARNLSQPSSVNPPRTSARSIVGTGGRSNSMQQSSIAAFPPHTNGDTDSYFPAQPAPQPTTLRRKSVGKPPELQIPAEKLYDYLQMFNVLVIDVRSRADFDAGHLYCRNIMCIEPSTLQDGYSAEQLQDRLVISPDDEQNMFQQRNKYQVVVYYDRATKTNAFLNKYQRNETESALKRVYDTLWEFNADKPLQRPPIFLMGGVEAWADLMGSNTLVESATRPGLPRPRGGIRRAPAVSHAARASYQKRRTREYASLDPEEERRWREEALRGRAVIEQTYEEEEEEPGSPIYRTTEDFLRRFPAVEDQASMMYAPSRPETKAQPYMYSGPPIPPAPSRPAPAVPRVSYSGVHERQVQPQQRTNQLATYVSPGRYGHIRFHRTGLINFGSTCYMNSVVQCLSANMDLSNFFLSQQYSQNLQRENWKGTKGLVSEAYATVLSNLFKGDVSSIRPSTFRKVCGLYNSTWQSGDQQDAKEFLEFIMHCLHEDLNSTWMKPPLKQLTEAEEMKREALPRPYVAKVEWNRYLHRDASMIGRLFAGQHASQLTCTTCGNTSTTYEAFYSISVEIPRDRSCDLRDCLRSYCSSERLDGDDIWRCPRCKVDREANKKITITRAPDNLIVHFKRFSASRTESARKVRTPIHFPLQGLDLGPFMEPAMTARQEANVAATALDGAAQLAMLKQDPAMNGPYVYNAYAVIWHIGTTLGSGHYIANVKDKAKGVWRRFNDDRIADFEPGRVSADDRLQNEKAYIVFYERERVAGGMT